jgi:hypothetical protein
MAIGLRMRRGENLMPHSITASIGPSASRAHGGAFAERDEVLTDLAAEHGERAATAGRLAARVWLWRQPLGSLPALVRRSWWRGWTGFEPRASRMQPGGSAMESWIVDLRYSARRLDHNPLHSESRRFDRSSHSPGAIWCELVNSLLPPSMVAGE